MIRSLKFIVTEAENNLRVDEYLMKLKGISRRVIIALKKLPDGMMLNGVHTRTIDIIHTGDVLEVNLPNNEKSMPTCEIDVPILYEDEDVLVYNKPANMPVHQSGGHIYGTLSEVYAYHCQKTGNITSFRAVNRLDKDTTGAVVAAKNQISAGILWKAVSKKYYCVVNGILLQKEGTIDLPIDRETEMEIKRIVIPTGQQAITHYKVIAEGKNASLIECILETGRTHQIRVHFSHIGYALIGDELYGEKSELIDRQALHCGYVTFLQPISRENLEIYAPFPQDFKNLLISLGFGSPHLFM